MDADKTDQSRQQHRRIRAWRAVDAVTRSGAEAYERGRHLPRLIPVGPEDVVDASPAARMRILLRLARALRSERQRARGGHWTYDLNRHLGLMQAYEAEARALRPGGAKPLSPASRAPSSVRTEDRSNVRYK